MIPGVVGRKCGMTRVFTEDGRSIPVTVVLVEPNRVTQVKSASTDGYCAIQVTTGQRKKGQLRPRKKSPLNKPLLGHFGIRDAEAGKASGKAAKAKKAGEKAAEEKTLPGLGLWEFRVSEDYLKESAPQVGDILDVSALVSTASADLTEARGMGSAGDEGDEESEKGSSGKGSSGKGEGEKGGKHAGAQEKKDLLARMVDVTGISKGKGYAGVIKRWNFSMQDATHGNSLSHRAPGSIGQCQTPGRVFKGKKMAGHMGVERVTVQNLELVLVSPLENLAGDAPVTGAVEGSMALLVKGAVPGAPGGHVIVRPAIKAHTRL